MKKETTHEPLRVLHVLNRMSLGGAEVWLMHALRTIDRSRYRMDFLVQQPGAFDAEIRSLGSNVIYGGGHWKPLTFAKRMTDALCEHGPYDVVHSHVHHYSGVVLSVARLAGVPVRVAHSHNDLEADPAAVSPVRRAYLAFTESLVQRAATHGFACSRPAAASLYGPGWESDRRWTVMPCGIDLRPFETSGRDEGAALRESLGVPAGAVVLGHVGSFTRQKNHAFLIEVARAAAVSAPRAHLLMVGDGPLRPEVESAVREAGLSSRVTFAGLRGDVPALMQSVMDVFVFPSLFEGSPLVLVETQAAGLPAVVSDTITEEIVLDGDLLTRGALTDSPQVWAGRALEVVSRRVGSADRPARRVAGSPYDVEHNVAVLAETYAQGV